MSGLEKVKFGFVRYANCWEDAGYLLKSLSVSPGEKVLSICSAGDNSFSLLTCDPEIVVAADLNESQIFLAKLKLAAIKTLEREEFLAFAGFTQGANRTQTYGKLRDQLENDVRSYWDANSA